MYTPSLPYRRLVKFANGIWDENRKTFYPFIVSSGNVDAKTGIRYFVKSIMCSAQNAGNAAAATIGYAFKVGGILRTAVAVVPATVAASNVNAGATFSVDVGVLTDANSEVATQGVATTSRYFVVYAEIPNEGTGVPVIVQ